MNLTCVLCTDLQNYLNDDDDDGEIGKKTKWNVQTNEEKNIPKNF